VPLNTPPVLVTVPLLFGKPINIWLGLLLALLVVLQVLLGTRLLKLPFVAHRVNGFVILAVALVHGFIGYMVWFHGWVY
jgi:hypothetical protein